MNLVFSTALVFLGEILIMLAELFASKRGSIAIDGTSIGIALMVIIGGTALVAGYMLGYSQTRNIWIITAVSVGAILIVEPLVTYAVFQQLPTLGAALGMALGFAGIIVTLLVR